MGLVYKAHDPNIDRTVAVKTVLIQHLSGEQATEYESRFRSEARAAGKLQHPNIVGVYDAGRDAGMAYIVMEFIDGEDLSQARNRGEKFTLERTLGIVTQLLAALNYAHEQGMVHRDIKPANVMLDRSGRVKLSDFGVARLTNSSEATRTQGSMVGTLKYMSPEQVQGLRDIDNRSDLFAVGVLLYEMVTGHKPFDGPSDFAISTAIVMQDPKLPSAQNPALTAAYDAAIMKALAKDRTQRYATARDFAMALRALGRGSDQPARTSVPPGEDASPAPSTGSGSRQGAATAGAGTSGTSGATGTAGTGTAAPTAVSQEMELVYWKEIQDSDDPADFNDFLKAFPNGTFTARARRRLRMLSPSEDSQGSAGSASLAGPAGRTALGAGTSGTAPSSPSLQPAPTPDATMVPLPATVERVRAEVAALEAERLQREQLAREAADRERQEQEAREAAQRARQEQEVRAAREAAERERQLREQQAREAQEAAERARKEQEAREAEQARTEQERKEQERKAQEERAAREAAELARRQQQEREAVEQARREQEARTAQAAAPPEAVADDATRLGRASPLAAAPAAGEDATRLAGPAFRPGEAGAASPPSATATELLALLQDAPAPPASCVAVDPARSGKVCTTPCPKHCKVD